MSYKNKCKELLTQRYQQLLDWVFPRRCPICDDIAMPKGSDICIQCKKSLIYLKEPTCVKCGKKVSNENQEYCFDCTNRIQLFEKGVALLEYESIVSSLYRFKYQGRVEYATFYGNEIAKCLGDEILKWKVEGIIPVPIHKSRLRKRGYNQSEEIAKIIGDVLHIKVYKDFIVRSKKTIPLKELNYEQREKNLKKAFKIYQNDVKLKTIIIVDDIYTTGNTINELTKILKQNGINKVYFVTVSIGEGY